MKQAIPTEERFKPLKMEATWHHVHDFGPMGAGYKDTRSQLQVIATVSLRGDYGDDRAWLHVSVAHHGRVPTYTEVKKIKDMWFTEDEKAIMVFPPKKFHVNKYENCLHLYGVIEGDDPLPEFSGIVGDQRSI